MPYIGDGDFLGLRRGAAKAGRHRRGGAGCHRKTFAAQRLLRGCRDDQQPRKAATSMKDRSMARPVAAIAADDTVSPKSTAVMMTIAHGSCAGFASSPRRNAVSWNVYPGVMP
jgi:hypothetical protein